MMHGAPSPPFQSLYNSSGVDDLFIWESKLCAKCACLLQLQGGGEGRESRIKYQKEGKQFFLWRIKDVLQMLQNLRVLKFCFPKNMRKKHVKVIYVCSPCYWYGDKRHWCWHTWQRYFSRLCSKRRKEKGGIVMKKGYCSQMWVQCAIFVPLRAVETA